MYRRFINIILHCVNYTDILPLDDTNTYSTAVIHIIKPGFRKNFRMTEIQYSTVPTTTKRTDFGQTHAEPLSATHTHLCRLQILVV